MKQIMNLKTVVAFFILVFIVVTSCKKEEEVTYSLNVATSHSKVADGKIAYIKLVAKDDSITSKALYSFEATFKNNKASTVGQTVAEGDYTVYAIIDMNGNAIDSEDPMPDKGDYETKLTLILTSDREFYIKESYWTLLKK